MRTSYKQLWLQVVLVMCCMVSGCVPSNVQERTTTAPTDRPRILVFSKTAGFRHASIETGIAAMKKLGEQNKLRMDATENSTTFTEKNLARYKAVVFLSTTGDILNDQQQSAFEKFIRAGGGYVGIHAASDTEYDWPWYEKLVGAYFKSHPAIQDATVNVTDRDHISTKHLPKRWQRRDEWYDYRNNPRGNVHVLATLDENTYKDGSMGDDHPIAWCHEFDGGRAWYTGGGHTKESFAEQMFLKHLLGGIQWAAGIRQSS